MKIESNDRLFRLTTEDGERRAFLDGIDMFYKVPKDGRIEMNPYDYFDRTIQTAWKLQDLGHLFPVNKCPPALAEAIENAMKLAQFTDAYMKHVLGLYLSLTE
jgi:hypothetical protein